MKYKNILLIVMVCVLMIGCGKNSTGTVLGEVDTSNQPVNEVEESQRLFSEVPDNELLTREELQASMSNDQELNRVLGQISLSSFSMESFSGQTLTQDLFTGCKNTLVIVWAPYNGSSVYELSDVQYIEDKIADKSVFQVIGMLDDAVDGSGARREDVIAEARTIVEDALVSYPVLIPNIDFSMQSDSGKSMLPICIVVDENGNIKYAWSGACDLDELMKIVESVMASN